jgi:hypothetical protein
MSDLFPKLKRSVRLSMACVQDSKQRDIALVWRGYIEALRETAVLSDDEHAAIADDLLPDLQDDPMADGWKEAGWLASFADDPEGVETLFVDWKKGRVPVRS